MAYNSSTGIVSETDITIEDIRSATGQSSYNIGEVIQGAISAGAINKWSKVKPLRWDSSGVIVLSGDNFKGSSTDRQNGIFFGLKAGASSIYDIHSASWDYVGYPTEDFRYTDFAGYSRYAKPTISARSTKAETGTIIGSAQIPLDLIITWTDDSHSVDILQCIPNDGTNLNNAYPCVVITNGSALNFVRALKNSQQGIVTPIVYNGVRQTSFVSYELPEECTNGSTWQITFCLLDQNAISVDIVNQWVNLSRTSLGGVPAIAFPGAINYQCTITQMENYHGTWSITDFNASFALSGNAMGTLNMYCSSAPLRDATYEWQVIWRGGASGSKSGTFTKSAGATGSQSVMIDMGFASTGRDVTITYEAYLYGIGTGGTHLYTLASKSGSITLSSLGPKV